VRSCSESSRARSAARRRPRVRLSLAIPQAVYRHNPGWASDAGRARNTEPRAADDHWRDRTMLLPGAMPLGECICTHSPTPVATSATPPWRRELRLQRATPPSGFRSTINWVGPTSRTTPANPYVSYASDAVALALDNTPCRSRQAVATTLRISGPRQPNHGQVSTRRIRSRTICTIRCAQGR
jgi:hypothetical protein